MYAHREEGVVKMEPRSIWRCCFEGWSDESTSQGIPAAMRNWKGQE